MKTGKNRRVTFHSKEDMSSGYYLSFAESILHNFDKDKQYEINDIIELYQIKLYFDNEIYLSTWSQKEIERYKQTVKEFWNTVRKFWVRFDDNNILGLMNQLEISYQPAFWSLTEKLKIYKSLSEDTFKEILNNPKIWLREILHQKNLVKHFGIAIKDYLVENNWTAELLLTEYETQNDSRHKKLYFPKSLSVDDIDQVISNYLDQKDPNLNYVRLIVKAKESSPLNVYPRTRLKAKRLEKKLNQQIFEKGTSINVGCSVSFADELDKPFKVEWDKTFQKVMYSSKWLDEQKDDVTLLHIFSILFHYVDDFGCITLTSKKSEIGVFESTLMQSKNDYPIGSGFHRKSNLSHLQIFGYSKYLERRKKSVEDLLLNFFDSYLSEKFGVKELKVNFPSQHSRVLEKIRLIAPEIESILKQYNLFVEYQHIDHELLQLSSRPISFKDIKSLVSKKYVYSQGDEYRKLEYCFFSDQSMLYYVEPFNDKYNDMFSLLVYENVKPESFKPYQKKTIDLLINEGYLYIDSSGFVKIKTIIKINLIGKLAKDEALSYWYYPESTRVVIDEMANDGLVYFGNTVFTESETKYFNFYLNKSEFTNGLDLRNKYSHGTNTHSEDQQLNDYFILLKLLILIALKIEDDLWIHQNCHKLFS